MNILITGGSGLVGSAIKGIQSNYKEHEFHFITSKDYNLESEEETQQMFQNIKPDYVLHLAAYVGGLYRNMNQKCLMFEKNIKINYNVVKYSHLYKVQKLIACLSTCIFPDKVTYPIKEDMLMDGPPHNSNNAYAYSKRMMYLHCKLYKEQYGDDFRCITPTNIYGPNDNFSLEDGHVIPSLIHKCYNAKRENTPFIVFGTGKPLRQFIYSYDLANIIMQLLFTETHFNNVIISAKEEYSIDYIANQIMKSFQYDSLEYNTTFSDGQYKKTASNENLLTILGDYKFTPIEEGIRRTIEWFQENFENTRK